MKQKHTETQHHREEKTVNANGKFDVTKKGNSFGVLCLDANSSFLHILVEEERHQIVLPPTEFPKF